jgi:hypothetical protein
VDLHRHAKGTEKQTSLETQRLFGVQQAAAADYLASPRPPELIDGWIVALLLFAYVVFYVLVLDRNQIHLYIPFTPRTHFCILAYAMMCAVNYGIIVGWGAVGKWSIFNQLDLPGDWPIGGSGSGLPLV